MDAYPPGFEENDRLRSAFIRDLTLQQLLRSATPSAGGPTQSAAVPSLTESESLSSRRVRGW